MKKLLAPVLAFFLILGVCASATFAVSPAAAVLSAPIVASAAKAKSTTAVKLAVSDRTPVLGQTINVRASVIKTKKPVKGAAVVFERMHAMTGKWTTIGKVKTNSAGSALLKRKVDFWDGTYRARYDGKSSAVEIIARPNPSWSLPSKKTIYRGQTLALTVNTPGYAGFKAELQLWDPKRKQWTGGTGLIHSYSPYKPQSPYSDCPPMSCIINGPKGKTSVKLWYFESKGTYKLRMFQMGSQVHADAATDPVTLTVK